MNLEEQLMAYKEMTQPQPREEKIQAAIQKSKQAFYAAEQEQTLPYGEFLWAQLKLVQKRWWLLQFLLLCMAGALAGSAYEEGYVQRGIGIMASLFVILMIPELWKNRSCQCVEIERASYYSLRQIYAARMVLFGIADVLLLSVFSTAVVMGLHMAFTKLLVEFLLPVLVTACICFGTLCSRRMMTETAAIALCIMWSVLWMLITLNEKLYKAVTLPVWMVFAGLALVFLCIAVSRTLKNCSEYWEVSFHGIGVE